MENVGFIDYLILAKCVNHLLMLGGMIGLLFPAGGNFLPEYALLVTFCEDDFASSSLVSQQSLVYSVFYRIHFQL
jgi:hypothetical protein